MLASPDLLTSLVDIMMVNLVMSGDNAVVIALAAQALPENRRKPAVIFGSLAAIVMRLVLTIFALKLLDLPYLKIVGGILLVVVAVKLLIDRDSSASHPQPTTIGAAIRTILVADLVMSLDNVLGVAAASHGNLTLLIIGLVLSIPLIAFGSGMVLKVMVRFPIVVVLGAALLGYLGGEMLFADVALHDWLAVHWVNREWGLHDTPLMFDIAGTVAAILCVLPSLWLHKGKSQT